MFFYFIPTIFFTSVNPTTPSHLKHVAVLYLVINLMSV